MTDQGEHFPPIKKVKLEGGEVTLITSTSGSASNEKKISCKVRQTCGESADDTNKNEVRPVKDDEDVDNVELVNPVTRVEDGKNLQGERGDVRVVAESEQTGGCDQENEDKERRARQMFCKIPPEVWDVLFEFVNDPRDILTVMNTCPAWYGVLKSKRKRLLFPLVLPLLTKHLPPSTILNFRLVCKHWKHCVDAPLQEHGTTTQKFESHWWHTGSPFEKLLKHLELPYLFYTPEKMRKFMQYISPTHITKSTTSSIPPAAANPFISRSITVNVESGAGFRPSLEMGVQLLQKFGHHVWEFTHFCPILGGQEDLAVNLLPSVLQNLINLKSLRIDWNSDGVMRVLPETQTFLQNKPFPPLPQLTHFNFDFRGGGELELALGTALLRCYGSQLTSLVCRGEFLEKPSLTPKLIRDLLPNLKNLRIFCVTSNCVQKLALLEGQFPLERLQLWYSFHNINFKTVVQAIIPFSRTLTQLHMDLKINYPSVPSSEEDDDSTPLQNSRSNHYHSKEFPSAEVVAEFPKLTNVSSPLSSINSPWFCNLVKSKFRSLQMIHLQTVMESSFAPYQKRHLSREIQRTKEFFTSLPHLEEIRFWFHNIQENFVLHRRQHYK